MPSNHEIINLRRERAYLWWQRLGGMLGREAMKKTIRATQGIDATEADVDLLPWDRSGKTIDMSALQRLRSGQEDGSAGNNEGYYCQFDVVACTAAMCRNLTCANSLTANGTRLLYCGKCMTAKYCSRECQLEHWKVHKKSCRRHGSVPIYNGE
jgi:hypothetical protein